MSEEEEILDYKAKPVKKLNVYWIYGIALALFVYWFVAGLLFWPFVQPALFLGMVLLVIAAIVRLNRSEENKPTAYAYFVGRIMLIAGVYLHVIGYPQSQYFMWVSFVFFAAGIASLYLRRKT
jgi:hypothetical protein